ncbi:MAG: hypothetical protein GY941_04565 [Planctomycetes bacterium]|nr:hypothetical protein [Planctomycetota bacterium]
MYSNNDFIDILEQECSVTDRYSHVFSDTTSNTENSEVDDAYSGHSVKTTIPKRTGSTDMVEWLDVNVDARFQPLINYDFQHRADYHLNVIPYLKDRGIVGENKVEMFVKVDLYNLAHALTIIFEMDQNIILQNIMPLHLFQVIQDVESEIDHVGRELFGPLDFYLDILREQAERLKLNHIVLPEGKNVSEYGDIVFQSVQVVKALRHTDKQLKGVTIAKIYLKDNKNPSTKGCLELFQVALRDRSFPQNYRFTLARLANLYANVNNWRIYKIIGRDINKGYITEDGKIPLVTPVCHISIRARDVKTVHDVHKAAMDDKTGMIMLYLDRVSTNPGDGSVNTKIAIRSDLDIPLYNKIIEVAHFDE